jgi:SAM-dependent methyltransferase
MHSAAKVVLENRTMLKKKITLEGIKMMLSNYSFDMEKLSYLKEITGSPLNLDNYLYAAHYILSKYPVDSGQSQASILDIGCFAGLFVDFLRKEGYPNAQGIDNSGVFVDAAKKIGIEIGNVDARRLSRFFEKSSFDVALCINVIHNDYHRPDSEVRDFALEIFREAGVVLKKGGIFFCSTFVGLPQERIRELGFENIYPEFSGETRNYVFRKTG